MTVLAVRALVVEDVVGRLVMRRCPSASRCRKSDHSRPAGCGGRATRCQTYGRCGCTPTS